MRIFLYTKAVNNQGHKFVVRDSKLGGNLQENCFSPKGGFCISFALREIGYTESSLVHLVKLLLPQSANAQMKVCVETRVCANTCVQTCVHMCG